MRWSIQVFKVNGISVELHLTFLLLFLTILVSMGASAFLLFLLAFTIVLGHELVHSLTAHMHGVRVSRIILTPIGGLANIELPDDPLLELKVSIVGPLFNFMLCVIGVFLLYLMGVGPEAYVGAAEELASGGVSGMGIKGVLMLLVSWNFTLGAFNMLPAFPMDGGRVFRSVLAMWMDYDRATVIAGTVGQFFMIALIGVGILLADVMLVVVGIFLLFAGGNEVRYVRLRRMLADYTLSELACSELLYVNFRLRWRDFIHVVYRRGKPIYLLVDDDGVVKKVLDVSVAPTVEPQSPVIDVSGVDYAIIDGKTKAVDVLKVILSKRLVLVAEGERLIGYVTFQSLFESVSYLRLVDRVR